MLTAGIALRGVEALIDLVACYLLLYILAAYTGSTTPGGGFYLRGAQLSRSAKFPVCRHRASRVGIRSRPACLRTNARPGQNACSVPKADNIGNAVPKFRQSY